MAKVKKDFLGTTKMLQKIEGRREFYQIFDDFMSMAICAFSYGKMEEEYLSIAKNYTSSELEIFGNALVEMIIEYNNSTLEDGSWKDILGNIFEETNSSFTASANGQFFTPTTICNLMAQLTCGKDEPCKENIYVNDCSSGSSRNLIAHSRLHPKNRFNAFYIAQDLDKRCVKMSVLNFIMFGMKGYVIHMNTLSMEIFKGYRIYLPETGLGIIPLSINQCKNILLSQNSLTRDEKIELNKQLTIF